MVRNIDLSRFQGLLARIDLKPFLAALALALMLFAPTHLLAQTTGSLTGVVKDSTGAIVPGARVMLVNTANKSVRVAVSNSSAFFSFAAIQTGIYDLNVSSKGFQSYVITSIEMHPGDSRNVENITLQLGRVEETVTVTASTAGVDLSSPDYYYYYEYQGKYARYYRDEESEHDDDNVHETPSSSSA